jgi:hypothetical protein
MFLCAQPTSLPPSLTLSLLFQHCSLVTTCRLEEILTVGVGIPRRTCAGRKTPLPPLFLEPQPAPRRPCNNLGHATCPYLTPWGPRKRARPHFVFTTAAIPAPIARCDACRSCSGPEGISGMSHDARRRHSPPCAKSTCDLVPLALCLLGGAQLLLGFRVSQRAESGG